jgi:hypothetical protein
VELAGLEPATLRVLLDAQPGPAAEPDDADIDEPHRPGKRGDLVGDAVLHALGSLFRVLDERWIWLVRKFVYEAELASRLACSRAASNVSRSYESSCLLPLM